MIIFRELRGYGYKGFKKMKGKLDKGHINQFGLLIERLKQGGEALIPFDEIVNVSKASFAVLDSIRTNKPGYIYKIPSHKYSC